LQDGTRCHEAAQLAAQRLLDVRAKLTDLMRIEAVLSQLIGACQAPQDKVSCPLIEAIQSS